MKKLYIDIDGVLVSGGKATLWVTEFLRFVTERFDCYWLSTHCQGDTRPVFLYLVSRLPSEALSSIEKIKPTEWQHWKTEAIDFSSPFVWLDDNLFEMERRALIEHSALDNFIHINLTEQPDQLADVIQKLS